MQFLVDTSIELKADELKEINYFRQQHWVQIICTNTNYKFGNNSFTENIKYYDMIEKINETIETTKATGKTNNCGTNDEKFQSKTVKHKNSKSK